MLTLTGKTDLEIDTDLHVKVGDKVNNPDCSRHEGDVVELRAWPLDDLQQALHHSARDESLTSGLVRCEVIQETEKGRGQRLRKNCVGLHSFVSGGSEGCNAAADENREEPVVACGAGDVNDRAQLWEVRVPVKMNDRCE